MRSERFAEIHQVVSEETPAILFDVGRERVVLFDIGMVDPSREDPQTSELASMLMGDRIVRVVVAYALRRQPAFGDPFDEFAGGGSVTSVRAAWSASQRAFEVPARVRLLAAEL